MKALPLLVLLTGCIHFHSMPGHLDYTAEAEPGGTRVTIKSQGISVLLPADGKPRGAQPWRQDTWLAGVMDAPNVSHAEVEIYVKPSATTLAEEEAELRLSCFQLEVLDRQETADGFAILYGCTNKHLESYFHATRVTDIGGRKVQCHFGGTLPEAKAAHQYCATMAAVPKTPATQAVTAK